MKKDVKKLKGICKSQSKNVKSKELKNCLDGKNFHEECDSYISRSIIHEMYLQEVNKSTLSLLDDKRCSINEIEILPWI